MLPDVASQHRNARRGTTGRPARRARRAQLVGLGAAALAAALMGAAGVAQADPQPAIALLLPSAAAVLWYRIRFDA